ALDVVAGQAAPAAVGGGGPGQIDLTAADGGRGEPGRIGGANRVGRRCRGGGVGHIRIVYTHIGGRIDRFDAVAVIGGGDEARITERGAGGGRDLCEVCAAGPLAALDAIAGD